MDVARGCHIPGRTEHPGGWVKNLSAAQSIRVVTAGHEHSPIREESGGMQVPRIDEIANWSELAGRWIIYLCCRNRSDKTVVAADKKYFAIFQESRGMVVAAVRQKSGGQSGTAVRVVEFG